MDWSLVSSRLYRIGGRIIAIAAVLACLFQIVLAQRPHRVAADKGPRAIGLLKFGPNGKPNLIPITIMVDGKFYDAGAYKASPVPMALQSGTVYEAVGSGVSQGLFSVTSALQGQSTWLGQGTWESEAEIKAAASRKKARDDAKPARKNDDLQDGPPVLRRAGATKSKPAEAGATISNTSATEGSAGSPNSSKNTAIPSPSTSSDENDPNRPHLGREKIAQPKPSPTHPPEPVSPSRETHFSLPVPDLASEGQLVPAISDAAGPEPRSYAFEMKPEEESKLRSTMLSMASPEVAAHANGTNHEAGSPSSSSPAARKGKQLKSQGPIFENVRLQAFDLSNSNEPVLILSAKAHMPPSKSDAGDPTDYFVTLVARQDMYAELHKSLSVVTDNQHMDTTPRLDLIDAVDIDGDGRGELLFRQVHDRGAAYVIYRVIGNQLWPLYQSAKS